MMSTLPSNRQPQRVCNSPAGRSFGSSPARKSVSKSPRKSSSLPAETVEYLKNWMMSPEHIAHPYPTEQEKAKIMADTGIELKKLTNWFVNNRKRFWKPRVEAKLQQEAARATPSPRRLHVVSPSHQHSSSSANSSITRSSSASFLDMTTRPTTSANTALPTNVSFVSSDTLAEFIAAGKPRSVSVTASSIAESDTSSLSSDHTAEESINADEVDKVNGTVKRTETVDVHVLCPTDPDKMPSLEDVSILPNIPSARILKTYRNCVVAYRFPLTEESDKKMEQSRRDAEVVRIKKQYLQRFWDELERDGFGGMSLMSARAGSKKRARADETSNVVELHRPKYQRQCITLWKDACRSADNGYDAELPSLEEATKLFGYEG